MQYPSHHGASIAPRSPLVLFSSLICLLAAGACGSAAAPEPDATGAPQSVGEAFFEAWCQGVSHAHDPLEVSGAMSRRVCTGREAVSVATPPDVQVLMQQRAQVVAAVDASVRGPSGEALRQWLDSLAPLADNGSLARLLKAAEGALRALLSHDAQTLARLRGWAEAGHLHALGAALWADAEAPQAAASWGRALASEPDAADTLARALQQGALAYAPEVAAWLQHSVRDPNHPGAVGQQLEAWGTVAALAVPHLAEVGPRYAADGAALAQAFWAWHHGVQPGLTEALGRLAQSLDTAPAPWLAGCSAVQVASAEAPSGAAQAGAQLEWAHEGVVWLTRVAARDGLLSQLIEVLGAPETAALGPLLAQQLRHSDAIDFDLEDVNGPVVGTWQTPTRPGGPPSTFARLLALVQAVAGKRMASAELLDPMPEYPPGDLFTVPDAGAFYVAALADRAIFTLRLAEDDFFFPDQLEAAALEAPGRSTLSAFTGIDGFTALQGVPHAPGGEAYQDFSVSPQAAGRLLFALHDRRVDPASPFGILRAGLQQVAPRLLTDAGVPVDEAFVGTLFAWEQGAFLQAVRPLAQAFVDHDAASLLVDGMVIMSRHWPEMVAADALLERRLAAWLDEGAGLAAARDMLQALGHAEGMQPGWSLSVWLAEAVAGALRPDTSGQSLADRLLAAALDAAGTGASGPTPQAAPPFQVVHGTDGTLQWAAPQQVAALAHGAATLARIAQRDAHAWAATSHPTGPVGAALERLKAAAPAGAPNVAPALLAPSSLAAARALGETLAFDLQHEATLRAALAHAGPVARALADVGAQGTAADGLDRHAALVRWLQALWTAPGPNEPTPAQVLAGAFVAVTDVQAAGGPPRPAGWSQAQALADFLGDAERGLPRFLALMAQRAAL